MAAAAAAAFQVDNISDCFRNIKVQTSGLNFIFYMIK
jgi:hypothetical protein